MNPRMNPPRGQNMSPLGSYSPGMRGPPPNTPLGPGGGGPNMPMSMGGLVGRPQWQPNANTVSIYFYFTRSVIKIFIYKSQYKHIAIII